ncbi:MAG: DUF4244 domain-containing protein [Nocardioidaceae bacterium]
MNHLIASTVDRPTPLGEKGMTTAEYAVGTVSACGFGGLLYTLLTSSFGQNLLQGIFDKITGLLPF